MYYNTVNGENRIFSWRKIMKKTTKRLLSAGLSLALALSIGGGLVACGGGDDKDKTPAKPKGVPYWLAGDIAGVNEWDNVTDARRMSKTDDADIYEIKLDMWEGDTFKVRYEGKGWDAPEGWQANYTNNFDADQKADVESKIIDGSGLGGSNFKIAEEGNYTIKLDVSGDTAVVSYTYNGEATNKAPKPVTGITLNNTVLTLEEGATSQLEAVVAPSNADDPSVTWASSDEAVATVSNTGLVTAVAAGTATITVTSVAVPTKKATCSVTVAEAGAIIPVTSLELNKEATTLHVNGEETLEATVGPENATNKTVGWASSDPETVLVDTQGKLTALKPGTVTITATAGEEEATCEVTVVKDLYIVGMGKAEGLVGWNTVTTTASAIPQGAGLTEDEGVYTLTADIGNGDAFKILTFGAGGGGWDDALGYGNLADADEEEGINLATQIDNDGGNIKILADGNYQITVKLVGTAYQVEIKRLGDLTAPFAWSYDVYFHGPWTGEVDAENNLVWSNVQLNTTPLNKDNLTVTANIELTAVSGFGVKVGAAGSNDGTWYNSDKMNADAVNTDAEDPAITLTTGANAVVNKAGTYNVTVTLDADGNVVSIVFNTFTPAAAA